MRWHSRPDLPEKFDRACLLAVALAMLLEQAGERIGLLGGPAPATSGQAAPSRLAAGLLAAAATGGLPNAPLPPHANLVLISDYWMTLEDLDRAIRRWTAAGVRGHLVQVLDPAEESLPYAGRIRLIGLESDGDVLLAHAESLREAYRDRLERHQAGLAAIARAANWGFTRHHTSQPARVALTSLYAAMAER
jgi:uncharacterized protein (DUF58 family)